MKFQIGAIKTSSQHEPVLVIIEALQSIQPLIEDYEAQDVFSSSLVLAPVTLPFYQ